MNLSSFIVYLFFLFFIFFCISFFLYFLKEKRKKKIFSLLDTTLFLVRMPHYEEEQEKQKKEIKDYISVMEQFYSSLFYLKERKLILEVASQRGKEDIRFYVAVPTILASTFENMVYGLFPHASLEVVPEDYTIFEKKGEVAGSYLQLKTSFFLPLASYTNFREDPLNILINALSFIRPEEGAAVQLILQPSKKDVKKTGEKVIFDLNEGKTLKAALFSAREDLKARFLKTINAVFNEIFEGIKELSKLSSHQGPSAAQKPSQEELKKRKVDELTLEAIRSKIKKSVFEVNIRLLVMAQNKERANEILSKLEISFKQFETPFNTFTFKRVAGLKLENFIYNFSFRIYNKEEEVVLNAEELAGIFHFPIPQTKAFGLQTVKTKEIPPPIELPEGGEIVIGKVLYRQKEIPVFFKTVQDRRRHFYIIGQTGTGKSSLLHELIRQDIEKGKGVGVIDPHGDLIEGILTTIPTSRYDDVVLFEPFDRENVSGLNMLEWDTPEEKDFAVSEMIMIFHKLFPPEIIGPMFEHYMRNAMLALMSDKLGTLVDVPRIFVDEDFLEWKLRSVDDPLVRNFWLKEWRQTVGQTRSDMLGYVVSKVGRFVENAMMRNIIGQSRSSFDLRKIMNEGKIFLANLSKGQTGELNSSLLGLILVSKMQMAAMSRASIPEEMRKDFYLYIDEFQNFTTDSVATILSEARKYRLNLTLAHQYIPQLPDEIKNAVVGNVGTFASFRVGAADAEFLEKIFQPEFSKLDLVNLDNFNLVIKIMIDGKISSPFKLKTIVPKFGNKEKVRTIKKISKLKYTRERSVVEEEIKEHSRLEEL